MQARRDQLCDGLETLGFTVFRPRGTYFVTNAGRPLVRWAFSKTKATLDEALSRLSNAFA